MPFYLGAFLAVALEWRAQARNAVLQAQTLQALETKATTLEEEMRTLGRQNEAYQTSLKQMKESKAETERQLAEALELQAGLYTREVALQVQEALEKQVASGMPLLRSWRRRKSPLSRRWRVLSKRGSKRH